MYKTFSVQLINENGMYFFQLLGTLIWFCDFIIAYFLYLSITFFRKIKYSEFSVNSWCTIESRDRKIPMIHRIFLTPDAPGENRRFPIAQKKDIKYKKNTSSIWYPLVLYSFFTSHWTLPILSFELWIPLRYFGDKLNFKGVCTSLS